jgi:KUP system potassium uptake protein
MNKSAPEHHHGSKPAAAFIPALVALGIVFGDLGTSPLYALQEAFHSSHGVRPTPDNVVGIISLFLWSLIAMVSLKYVFVLMRADNRGEGGILALLALLVGDPTQHDADRRTRHWVYLALIGTAMLYGDGVITPAISVLSAVEGLGIATLACTPYIVPLTIVILVGLFAIQPFGSGRVGVAFGPILAIWFVIILVLGLASLSQTPAILAALNPFNGITFFSRNGGYGFIALGAVVLCLTGGEALYADMGHFGRQPIRIAWYGLALPALAINYLGQGALLLRDPSAAARPFYSLVPDWALYPMVALATLATIIASQALISAVFSLTSQAVQLGLNPRVQTVHTSARTIGQIYMPGLNWLLMLGTITVVLIFGSSERLAAAFGLAVSTTMAITTVLFAVLASTRWRWPPLRVALVAGGFLTADLAFVAANSLKFADGGWLPFVIGVSVFLATFAWFNGRAILHQSRKDSGLPVESFISALEHSPPHRVRGIAVFLTEQSSSVPTVLLHHLKHNQVLHETVVLLTLMTDEAPRLNDQERIRLERFNLGFIRIVARFGFMEEPNVPKVLCLAGSLIADELYNPMTTSFYLGRESLVVPGKGNLAIRWLLRLFVWLRKNERDATSHFGIPPNRVVEMGARLELTIRTDQRPDI